MKTSTASLLALSSTVSAFWRMNCGVIQTGRIDPIVSPGGIASHVHKVSGASSFSQSSSYNDLVNSRCTTCSVQDDKSAYWTPQLYYSHADGTFEEVSAGGMTVYYLGRGDNRTNIKPFPPGFKMISGSNLARSFDNNAWTFRGQQGVTLVNGSCDGQGSCTSGTWMTGRGKGQFVTGRPIAEAVSYKCLGGNETETPGFQYTNCPYGLRAQLQFQSCWDRVNLYKSDNSHVAYMSQLDNGMCPPTHPVQLAHLFYEVLYGVNDIKNKDGKLVFANGDTTGYGFHGDFLNGWNMDTQTAALKECINTDNNGQISACAPLMKSNSDQASSNCPEGAPIVDEPVHGILKQLPGCISMTSGPGAATASSTSCGVNSTLPMLKPTTTNNSPYTTFLPTTGKTYNGWNYLGCASDAANSRVLSVASFTNKSMTNEICQSFCTSKNLPLAGLEYGSECYCGYSLAAGSTLGQNCNSMICAGNSSQLCGGPSRLSLWNSTTFSGPRRAIPSTVGETLTVNGVSTKYLGCSNDNLGGRRALTNSSYTDGSKMTIESCSTYCAGKGWSLAGLEYSSECYCGAALVNGGTIGASTACGMQCSGNATEVCGGPGALSVWDVSKLLPVKSAKLRVRRYS